MQAALPLWVRRPLVGYHSQANFQLSEVVQCDNYPEWIAIVATFTVDSFKHCAHNPSAWQLLVEHLSRSLKSNDLARPGSPVCLRLPGEWASNSVYYLLSLWSRLVASMPYLKGETPSHLEQYVPQVITAFINSRMELVATLLHSSDREGLAILSKHFARRGLTDDGRWCAGCPSCCSTNKTCLPGGRPIGRRRTAERAARHAAVALPLPVAAGAKRNARFQWRIQRLDATLSVYPRTLKAVLGHLLCLCVQLAFPHVNLLAADPGVVLRHVTL